jgi:hypothetical protein
MTTEQFEMEWRELPEYPGYLFSEDGQVYSHHSKRPLKPQAVNGYLTVTLGRGQQVSVHRLICAAFHGPAPQGMAVNHKDLNRHNNNADNLEWTTQSDNVKHAYEHRARTIDAAHKARCAELGRLKRKTTDEEEAAIRAAFSGKRGDISRLAVIFQTTRDIVTRVLGR